MRVEQHLPEASALGQRLAIEYGSATPTRNGRRAESCRAASSRPTPRASGCRRECARTSCRGTPAAPLRETAAPRPSSTTSPGRDRRRPRCCAAASAAPPRPPRLLASNQSAWATRLSRIVTQVPAPALLALRSGPSAPMGSGPLRPYFLRPSRGRGAKRTCTRPAPAAAARPSSKRNRRPWAADPAWTPVPCPR